MADVLKPRALVLPTIPVASQLSTAPAGTIGMSGGNVVYATGSGWKALNGV